MRRLTLTLLLCLSLAAQAQTRKPQPDDKRANPAAAIFGAINQSAADWNRGDLDAFASSYKNSPNILFLGPTLTRGYDQMLAHYKASYPTPEKMGQLSFTQLDTQPLAAPGQAVKFATVTGHYRLDRSASVGGVATGFFLLVVEHTPAGWKIICDDTTALPPPAPLQPPSNTLPAPSIEPAR